MAGKSLRARNVFSASLNYDLVRVHECAKWTDALDRFGRWIKGLPEAGPGEHNAITLGNHCYFPVNMASTMERGLGEEAWKMDWLIHELTHAWQFQHMGWKYFFQAIGAQLRLGAKAYDYGGAHGLEKHRQEGNDYFAFNLEQQGKIAQDFYKGKLKGQDTRPFEAYIKDVQDKV